MAGSMSQSLLKGIRVVDFSWVQAGPWVGRFFANYGAEVIRIESTLRMDWARNVPGDPEVLNGKHHKGALFTNVNCDKLGITLNLKHPKAIKIAWKLIAISDVVIDNFTADVMENLGLGYDDLIKIKPDIIALSMPVFGKTGPYRNFGGYGNAIWGMAGLDSLSGKLGQPLTASIALADFGPNPTHAAIALLAALHYRNRTGKGQFIELAQLESTACWLGPSVLDYTVNRHTATGHGNRSLYAAPHGVYRCTGDDKWCAIAVQTEEEWASFCKAIDKQELIDDIRFSSLAKRKENEDQLDWIIEAWAIERTPEEVMTWLQDAGVAAGVVETGEDLLLYDQQAKYREYFVTLDHPDGKTFCENTTIAFSGTPARVRRPGPVMGQDNEYVYKEILGMTEEEINKCYVDGVFD